MFTRKLLKQKWTHESFPTAWVTSAKNGISKIKRKIVENLFFKIFNLIRFGKVFQSVENLGRRSTVDRFDSGLIFLKLITSFKLGILQMLRNFEFFGSWMQFGLRAFG